MSFNYYNEYDPYAAAWLRNLIEAGLLAPGEVDERSIEDVTPADLRGFTQCHFFAGIGVWPYAIRRGGWPDDRPIWSGSCPCQPFSAAGKGDGFADQRHLWPSWNDLIKQCKPPTIVGEQVASAAADAWIDLVQTDLEALGYAFGAQPFPAASIGAPHIRDRDYWMAHASWSGNARLGEHSGSSAAAPRVWCGSADSRQLGLLDHADVARLQGHAGHGGAAGWTGPRRPAAAAGVSGGLAHSDGGDAGAERQQRSGQQRQFAQDGGAGELDSGRLADVHGDGREPRREGFEAMGHGATAEPDRIAVGVVDALRGGRQEGDSGCAALGRPVAEVGAAVGGDADRPGPINGFWRAADWLLCRDGKWRPVEPGTFPLVARPAGGVGRVRADQEPEAAGGTEAEVIARKDQGSRVGRLRGYGNALNAEQATEFMRVVVELTS